MPVSADRFGKMAVPVKGIRTPSITAYIDPLIGSNAPKMFEPWSFIGSHGDGPCAIRTALGLVIRGLSEVASRISLCRLEETLSKQNNHAFNRKSYMVEGEMEKKLAELKFEEEAELKRKKWRKQREKVQQRRRELENKAQRKKVKLKRKEIVAWLIKTGS